MSNASTWITAGLALGVLGLAYVAAKQSTALEAQAARIERLESTRPTAAGEDPRVEALASQVENLKAEVRFLRDRDRPAP